MPDMYKVPHSPQPTHFRVSATGADVADAFTDAQPSASAGDPDGPPTTAHEPWKRSRRPDYVRDACAWWENWVPVAATGWGALVVIAPLLVTHFLVWAAGARRDE